MQQKKAKDRSYNLTEGSILNKLLLVALPVIGSQIVQMTYNLTDMFWLGRVGSHAVAASGSVGMYLWLSMAFLILGARGAEIGVSQNIGKGDYAEAKKIGQSSFTISVFIGAVVGLGYITFARQLIGFFSIQEQGVVTSAENYLRIVSVGLPFVFGGAAVTGIFNGSGNSRTPFYINLVSLGINMALDPLLIFTFDMGVEGAAIATVIAQIVSFMALTYVLCKGKRRPVEAFRIFALPEVAHLKKIFQWTLPIAIESFLFTFLSMIISRFVAAWGANALATQRIGSQVESLSWLIAGGFSSALTAYVGQNYGARKWNRIHKGVKISTTAMGVWGIIITAILFFGGNVIYNVFLPGEPEVVEGGIVYLKILSTCQLLACLEAVASGAFRGMGKTVPPSIVSAVTNAARVVLAYFLSKTSLGLYGIWAAIGVGAGIRGLWMYVWYRVQARKLPKEDIVNDLA